MTNLIKDELLTDEHILWSGQPDKSKIFTKGDFLLIPFSLMWGGFAIFWELTVLSFGGPILFKLWGIPFVLVGLYLIFGRFMHKSSIKKKTYYYVTNKRVIVLKDKSRTNIEAEFIDALPAINKNANRNGCGDVIFGNAPGFMGLYANSGMDFFVRNNRYGGLPLSFFDIDKAKEVYKMVNEIRNGTYVYL